MSIWNRLFRHKPVHYVLPSLLGLLIAALSLMKSGTGARLYWVDALTVSGAVVILVGLLVLLAHFGAFDTFSYAFSTLSSVRRYKNLYEYSVVKQEARSRSGWFFVPYLAVGLLLLGAGAVLWAC